MASNAAHATDAGCNKCKKHSKKCEQSEKYEKCDNFGNLRYPPAALYARHISYFRKCLFWANK